MPAITPDVSSNDHVRGLKALRDSLAEKLDICESGRDFAALANRLQAVMTELSELDGNSPGAEVTPLDELEERRKSRGSAAARGNRAKK